MKIKIEKTKIKDISEMAMIASENFSGLKNIKDARKWVRCNFLAFPRAQYFIAKVSGKTAGYILWLEKSGFRKESVFELEQIAVKKDFQGQGIGTKLIKKSFLEINKYLKKRKSKLKIIEVTTRTENKAQDLYRKCLGVETECVIKDLFRGDEVIMIKRFLKPA